MQYLTFTLEDIEFAVEVGVVETVVDYAGITSVPTSLDYVRGVMDLRGRTVAVVDLRRKFGLPDNEKAAASRVIVLTVSPDGVGRETVGALVDDVSEVISLTGDAAPQEGGERSEFWRRYVRGIARVEGRMIVLIDSRALFSPDELDSVSAEAV